MITRRFDDLAARNADIPVERLGQMLSGQCARLLDAFEDLWRAIFGPQRGLYVDIWLDCRRRRHTFRVDDGVIRCKFCRKVCDL